MSNTRKKWIVFTGVCVPLALVSAFWLRTGAQPEKATPKVGSAPTPAIVQSNEHELKMLAKELEKKPGHVPVLFRMAQLLREAGKLDDAVARLRQVLKKEPGNADARLELGRVLYEKGQVQAAIDETQEILRGDPHNVDALYNLGAIYANVGQTERARGYWQQAVKGSPASDSGKKAADGLQTIAKR